ncbi:MAG TPA: helix-turn-helix domain-containing protein [Crenalkalicoccus sp.]|jgi:CRP-like cAMP-binding protein|nr:helix-turn-helix domain-containing protein [Crenalkalicoccus sp.]
MRVAPIASARATAPPHLRDGTDRAAHATVARPTRTAAPGARATPTLVGTWHGEDQAVPGRRPGSGPLEALESVAMLVPFRRGQKIYDERDPVERWYRVARGAAKEYALLADGRQQIVDFLLPGDIFGFGAHDEHHFTAEVVAKGTVLARYPRREVETLAERDPRLGRLLREIAFEAAARSQTRMLALARMRAPQRVGAFLLEMAGRLSAESAEGIALPMSRYDIADYLGLSAEAVSRSFTKLKRCGVIRLSGTRRVRILDRTALEWE